MKTQYSGSDTGGFSSPSFTWMNTLFSVKHTYAMIVLCTKPVVNQKRQINFASMKSAYDSKM